MICSNTSCYLFVSFNYVLMRAIHLPDTKKPADLNATLSSIWFKSCVKEISYLFDRIGEEMRSSHYTVDDFPVTADVASQMLQLSMFIYSVE